MVCPAVGQSSHKNLKFFYFFIFLFLKINRGVIYPGAVDFQANRCVSADSAQYVYEIVRHAD